MVCLWKISWVHCEPVLERLSVFGHPEMTPSPKYLVYPASFTECTPSMILHSIQVIDFGESHDRTGSYNRWGIPANYASPEQVLRRTVNQASDCWSLGCVTYEIRLGTPLFHIPHIGNVPLRTYLVEVSHVLGELPEELAAQCRIKHPIPVTSLKSARLQAIQRHLQQSAVEQGKPMSQAEREALADLLERLLRYEPEERMSANAVLNHPWFQSM